MSSKKTVAEQIATLITAIRNCEAWGTESKHGVEWKARHTDHLQRLCREALPSGAGFDNGTTLDVDASTSTKLVFHTSFHHMDEHGGYDGWTDHTVTVTPTFGSIDVNVTDDDEYGYIGEVFYTALSAFASKHDEIVIDWKLGVDHDDQIHADKEGRRPE